MEKRLIENETKDRIRSLLSSAGPEKTSKSLSTISKIINNILKNIDDTTKRELKLSNTVISRDIVPHAQACDILVIVS